MAADEIVVTVNSPGEVSTWLAPTVAAVKALAPSLRVSVMILPCLYASGTEAEVIRRMAGVDAVVGPRESFRYIVWGREPSSWRPTGQGVVVYLGGELLLAARLGRRLGYPVAAYTEGYINTPGAFARVFVPREGARDSVIRKGVTEERVRIVGDLMIDAANVPASADERKKAAEFLGLGPNRPVVAIFPGSRPHELRVTIPLFVEAAALLAKALPQTEFVVALAPYVTREMLASSLDELDKGLSGAGDRSAELVEKLFAPQGDAQKAEATLPSPRGNVKLLFGRGLSRAAMAGATLALTIPGSNTAELAAWGVPMLVCLPLSRPEEIPIDGVLGYIDKIPLVGRKLKAKAVLKAAERTHFVALPNRIAKKLIVPELRSMPLEAEEIAREAERLLRDQAALEEMGARLVEAMGPGGAAQEIARQTLELMP